MIIYAAIDILDGKCVRLTQGKREQKTIYFDNPLDAARKWEEEGVKWLHIVDLNGAFEGISKNLSIIENIIKNTNASVQVGGGIRNIETMENLINIGVERVIIGTSAVFDEVFLEDSIKKYRDKLVVSVDAKDGYVATKGWVNISEFSAYNFAKKIVQMGINTLVYTDISKDGTKSGPNFNSIEKICNVEGAKIIASGGISTLDDIDRLKNIGAAGAIIGKAIYDGQIRLKDAILI